MAVVYDYEDHRLKAYDTALDPLWSAGRESATSIPLSNPTDLQVTPDGEVWILDAPSRKIGVWSAKGVFLRSVSLTRGVHRFVRTGDGRIWATDDRGKVMWYIFEASGRLVDSIPVPAELAQVPPLAREGYVAMAGDNGVAVAHRYGSLLEVWSPPSRTVASTRGVEPLPFGKVSEWTVAGGGVARRMSADAPRCALAVAGDTSGVYVLFGGKTAQAGRAIDVYDAGTMQYRGSYTLPAKAIGIARTTGGFWVLTAGDLPELQRVVASPRG